jgi:predicted phosphoadenosine phosphosulfate sulfurtransferase
MFKNGVSVHKQRLCQPFGDDQKNGLDQFKTLEPDTWVKVVKRVKGANFGNIYSNTELLGNIKSTKPLNMTWESYTIFILEIIGMYNTSLQEHLILKIKKLVEKNKLNWINDSPHNLEILFWKRISRTLEKNDIFFKRIELSTIPKQIEKTNFIQKKYDLFFSNDNSLKNKEIDSVNKGID